MTISRSKLAKLKPDPNQPWCSQCRAHTHFNVKRVRGSLGTNDSGSTTVFKYFYCDNCESNMWVPREKIILRNAAFIFGSLFALILGKVYLFNNPGFEIYFAFLIPVVLLIMSFSGHLKNSRWEKWAIEQGWKKSKDWLDNSLTKKNQITLSFPLTTLWAQSEKS